jgi:hypothetical protein
MPVNNHAGHGFFQFSPELFFNLFVPANGFEVKSLMVAPDHPFATFYSVTSPQQANSRIELVGNEAVMLFLVARKIGNVDKITTPVQNDYSIAWKKPEGTKAVQQSKSLKQRVTDMAKQLSLRKYFIFSIQRNEKARRKKFSLTNPGIYSEVNIESWKMNP